MKIRITDLQSITMAVPHIAFVVLLAATVLIGFPGGWKNLGAWNIFAAYEGVNAVAQDVVDGTTCNTFSSATYLNGFAYRLIGGSGAAYVAPIVVGGYFGLHFGPVGMFALGTGGYYVGSKISGFLVPSETKDECESNFLHKFVGGSGVCYIAPTARKPPLQFSDIFCVCETMGGRMLGQKLYDVVTSDCEEEQQRKNPDEHGKMIPVFPLVAAAFALLLFLEEPQNALFLGFFGAWWMMLSR